MTLYRLRGACLSLEQRPDGMVRFCSGVFGRAWFVPSPDLLADMLPKG